MSQFFVVGQCVGLKSKDKPPALNKATGVMESKKDWHVGIAVAKENGFEGETEIVAVKIGDAFQEAGMLKVYTDFKGKPVMLPVKPFAYSQRGGDSAAISWQLAGEGQPRAVPNLQPLTLKAAAQ